jgi:hypothetical protein
MCLPPPLPRHAQRAKTAGTSVQSTHPAWASRSARRQVSCSRFVACSTQSKRPRYWSQGVRSGAAAIVVPGPTGDSSSGKRLPTPCGIKPTYPPACASTADVGTVATAVTVTSAATCPVAQSKSSPGTMPTPWRRGTSSLPPSHAVGSDESAWPRSRTADSDDPSALAVVRNAHPPAASWGLDECPPRSAAAPYKLVAAAAHVPGTAAGS